MLSSAPTNDTNSIFPGMHKRTRDDAEESEGSEGSKGSKGSRSRSESPSHIYGDELNAQGKASEDKRFAEWQAKQAKHAQNGQQPKDTEQSARPTDEPETDTQRKRSKPSTAVVLKGGGCTIFAMTDINHKMIYISQTRKNPAMVRPAALAAGAPMFKQWLQEHREQTTSKDWKWPEHLRILARRVPFEDVTKFKTMLMSDYDTIWSEGSGTCNCHTPCATEESEYPAMREALRTKYSPDNLGTAIEAANAYRDIFEALDQETLDDDNQSDPSISLALALCNETVEALQGSKFWNAVKKLHVKYHKPSAEWRQKKVDPYQLYRDLLTDNNNGNDDILAYNVAEDRNEELYGHKEAVRLFKELRNDAGLVNQKLQPLSKEEREKHEHKLTYSFVAFRLKLILNTIAERDSVNKQSFQSEMAWTQPTFIHPKTKQPIGYAKAIENAERVLVKVTDLTEWQRKQVTLRLALLERMQAQNAALSSLPVRH